MHAAAWDLSSTAMYPVGVLGRQCGHSPCEKSCVATCPYGLSSKYSDEILMQIWQIWMVIFELTYASVQINEYATTP